MIVGAVQFDVAKGDKEQNLSKIERLIDRRADLIVLPELFSTGYYHDSRSEYLTVAENVPCGPTTEWLCEIAARNDCFLTGAIVEIDDGELYITAAFAGPEGYMGKHRKRHLTERERSFFACGAESRVFDVRGCKAGVLVCFEGWFPESARELKAKGANILCHTALTTSQDTLDVMRVRAMENNAFVVMANSVSTEHCESGAVTFRGDSRVIGCDGRILANAGRGEGLVTAEIDVRLAGNSLEDCGDLIAEMKKHRHTMFGEDKL